MSCRYKNECPSYSGWCDGPKQDFSRCVEFLITAYENEKARGKAGEPQEIQKECKKVCQQGFSACVPVHSQVKQSQEI